jgi:hypothetical protein
MAIKGDRKAKPEAWLVRDEPRSQQLHGYFRDILRDYIVFQNERIRMDRGPEPTEPATALAHQPKSGR